MKTLAIRLEDEQHARLSILARLAGVTVTETIRQAIEARLEAMAADPELSARAASLAADIEREATEQREALTGMFGSGTRPAAGRAKAT